MRKPARIEHMHAVKSLRVTAKYWRYVASLCADAGERKYFRNRAREDDRWADKIEEAMPPRQQP